MLRTIVAVLFVAGFALLAAAVVLGFEEPDGTMLMLGVALIVAAVAAVFLHLRSTRRLTSAQKRQWLRLLTGRHAPQAWSEYLTASDLSAAAMRLSQNGARDTPS